MKVVVCRKNCVVAKAWHELAKENGENVAQNYIDNMKREMASYEINMAEQIAEQIRLEIGQKGFR
jgi:phage shock protein A